MLMMSMTLLVVFSGFLVVYVSFVVVVFVSKKLRNIKGLLQYFVIVVVVVVVAWCAFGLL